MEYSFDNISSIVFFWMCQMKLREKRDYKQKIRQEAIKRYGNKCMISGVSQTFQAAYIKPVTECKYTEKRDIDNILLLKSDIHTLLDEYKISINPQHSKVIVDESCDIYFRNFNGVKLMNLTIGNKQYLKHHYTKFKTNNTI